MHWQATGEALVVGKVTSLATAVAGNFLYAGTDAGCMYKVDIEALEPQLVSEHPAAAVVSISFDSRQPDIVHCIDASGVFRTYSLSDYTVTCKGLAAGAALCTHSAEEETACGYADGSVRAFAHGSGSSTWSIPKAHR
jgi:hypothetical protein